MTSAPFSILCFEGGGPGGCFGGFISIDVQSGPSDGAFGERVLLARELVAAGGELAGAAGELVEPEQLGLVGVEQAGALALGALQGRW